MKGDNMDDLNSFSELEKIAKIWQIQLNLEYTNLNRNVKLAFKDIGAFTEFLTIGYYPKYVGSGSGGMGLDLQSEDGAIEVKSCCTIQNAKCNKCGAKFNNLFIDKCPVCKRTDYRVPSDSRFSISAKEILRQLDKKIIDGLVMCWVEKRLHDEDLKTITLGVEWFEINFDDKEIIKYQKEYFENQASKGKKDTCNLLPNSYDFYKLCPINIDSYEIIIDYNDLNKKPTVVRDCKFKKSSMRVPESIMTKKEKEQFIKLSTYDNKTKTADAREFTKLMGYRRKSLGKQRGDTRANVYGRLGK